MKARHPLYPIRCWWKWAPLPLHSGMKRWWRGKDYVHITLFSHPSLPGAASMNWKRMESGLKAELKTWMIGLLKPKSITSVAGNWLSDAPIIINRGVAGLQPVQPRTIFVALMTSRIARLWCPKLSYCEALAVRHMELHPKKFIEKTCMYSYGDKLIKGLDKITYYR